MRWLLCTCGFFWVKDLKLLCRYYRAPKPGRQADRIDSNGERGVRQASTSAVPSSELDVKYWEHVTGISAALGREGQWAAWACLCALRIAQSLIISHQKSCGGACCWCCSPEPAALHSGLINRFCKAVWNILGGSCGSRAVFNFIPLLCYHNDCFERFELLFFKEIFDLIHRKLPWGGGRTLSSERLQVTAQSRDNPPFCFGSLPLHRLVTQKALKPLCLSISEVKHWACSVAVTSRKFGTFLK